MARFKIYGYATVTFDDVIEAETIEEAYEIAENMSSTDFNWNTVYTDSIEVDMDSIEEL